MMMMIVLDEGDGDNKDDDYDEKCGNEKLKGGSTQTLWIAWCFASDTSPGRKLQKITRFFGQRRCVYNQQDDENDDCCSQMTGYDDPNELGTCTPRQAAEGVLR